MTRFIRVRSASGPEHEFDVAEALVGQNPDAYVVVDPEPVETPRPTTYLDQPVEAKPARSRATTARTKRASKEST